MSRFLELVESVIRILHNMRKRGNPAMAAGQAGGGLYAWGGVMALSV